MFNTMDLVDKDNKVVGEITIHAPSRNNPQWVTTLILKTEDMKVSEDRFNFLCVHGIPGVHARNR